MHSRANSPFSAGDGMAHGFYETNINGLHVIAHGGDTVAFHSDLHLFLDKGVGIFVSFNSAGQGRDAQPLRDSLFTDFADRYFPEAPDAVKADPTNAKGTPRSLRACIRRHGARRATSSPSLTSSARRKSASTRTAIR